MRRIILVCMLLAVLLLGGCAMRTVEDMYSPPRRSAEFEDIQQEMDRAMSGLEYAAPRSGEYRQAVQTADLNGDGMDEYLLFAKDTSENPLKIMIFARDEDGCRLVETLEYRGATFDTVDYVDLDGNPGLELIVGRQVSNMVLRSVSVYYFPEYHSKQLMSVNYSRIVPADLNSDGISELMIISRGESDADNAVAALYSFEDGSMTRSREARLSGRSDDIKRIMTGKLYDDVPAVYVATSINDSAVITDVFALTNKTFSNVSFSNESGTSDQTQRNYYVYANDIDQDGVPELPALIDMVPMKAGGQTFNQQMIRWYALKSDGSEVDKMYTFHDFDRGWFLQLDEELAFRISVTPKAGSSIFYLWDADFDGAQELMTIRSLTGTERETADRENRYVLHRTDSVVYTVETEALAAQVGITNEMLAERFHMIQTDWKNGET